MTEAFNPITVGRYLLHRKIARGGMASIHIARLMGDVGFSRIVAAKRMHPELAEDDDFVAMFLDEANIASKVKHRNVVNVLDVVTLGDEVMLVQEYLHGVPLSVLLRNAHVTSAPVPVPVAAAIACNVLAGVHAAHEAVDELGTPLHIVHRDVSPQNVIVGTDGTARLLDFGVAKAALGAHVSRKGTFKGKLAYSAPEQIRGDASKHSDIYALGVVFWELLVGHRLHHRTQSEAELIAEILAGKLQTITEALAADRTFIGPYRWGQLAAIEPVIRKSLDENATRRWETAADMEEAIAAAVPIASPADVAAWLRAVGKDFLDEREAVIAEEEASWRRISGNAPASAYRPTRPPTSVTPLERMSRPPSPAPEALVPRASRHAWWLRTPVPVIAVLAMVLLALVTVLVRDGRGDVSTAPAISVDPSVLVEAPAAPSPPAPAPSPVVAPPPAPIVKSSSARARAKRRVPPPAPVAVPPPAQPPVDCTTPFYFEGRKKIFKAACL